MADVNLVPGILVTDSFGNNFDGQTDADGLITANFQNTGDDLVLSVTGFDIDFPNEVEARLNGSLLGNLIVGPNNGLNDGDSFDIPLARQISGTNEITFEQKINDTYKWGVTDLLLSEAGPAPVDLTLTPGVLETRTFGNRYDGNSDADGIIRAAFESTGTDLTLSLDGYDIDFVDEVEVLLNGASLGFLSVGPNEALNAGDSFGIAAADQIAGTNILTIQQTSSPTYVWGFTNVLLESASPPDPESGTVVTTTDDIVATDGKLSLREAILNANDNPGADTISFNIASGSVIELAADLPTITDDLTIDGSASDAGAGSLVIDGVFGYASEEAQNNYDASGYVPFRIEGATVGLEDLTVQNALNNSIIANEADLTLTRTSVINGDGTRYDSVYGIDATGGNLTLDRSDVGGHGGYYGGGITFSGTSVRLVDSEVSSNYGYLEGFGIVGTGDVTIERSIVADNDGGVIRGYGIAVSGLLQIENSSVYGNGREITDGAAISINGSLRMVNSTVAGNETTGINVIAGGYAQLTNVTTTFDGLTIDPNATLTIENSIVDGAVTGSVDSGGNNIFTQSTVSGTIASDMTGVDQALLFAELVPVFEFGGEPLRGVIQVNGSGTPTVALLDDPTNPAIDNADAATAPATDQRGIARSGAGPDIGSFELQQTITPTADIVLVPGQLDTNDYGNKFNGTVDTDGDITASFIGDGTDLTFSLVGFDVDYADEIEVLLNGSRLGFLSKGPNDGLNGGDTFAISAGQQEIGENILTIRQAISDSYKWGFTDLLLQEAGEPPFVDADIALSIGQLDTTDYGNRFNGTSDTDGVITAGFVSTGAELDFSIRGFDIDYADEVVVEINGKALGSLSVGPNEQLNSGDTFRISAADQVSGDNVITIRETGKPTYVWGFTDLLLEEVGPPGPDTGTHVTTLADEVVDDGELSLREAIANANANPGLDTITFAGSLLGKPLVISQGDFNITDDLVIDGDAADGGSGGIFINLASKEQGFVIDRTVDATFEDLTVLNRAHSPTSGREAAAIDGGDRVSVIRSAIVDNVSGSYLSGVAGGLSGADTVSIVDSLFENNFGGAVGNVRVAEISASAFIGNDAGRYNGVIQSGFIEFDRSSAIGNTSTQGALFGENVIVTNSTISGNYGYGLYNDFGGGAAILSNTATISDSTITGNQANGQTGAGGVRAGSMDVANSIIAGNITDGRGSFDPSEEGSEVPDTGPAPSDVAVVTLNSNGQNIFGQSDVPGVVGSDLVGVGAEQLFRDTVTLHGTGLGTPILAGAALDNGGGLPTVALLDDPANPAIDNADPTTAPATDQRGVAISGAGPDIGSFELQQSSPITADIALTLGVLDTNDYGNRFNGTSDADGVITVGFVSTGEDIDFSIRGFDIDYTDEVVVELNGSRIGSLSVGPNEQLNSGDTFRIAALDQVSGENVLSIIETGKPTYVWGFTDLLVQEAGEPPPPPPISADIALTVGVVDSNDYGNKFNGTTDADGVITAGFVSTGVDLDFSIVGFDIDYIDEVVVELNGSRIGSLSQGPNEGLNGGDTFRLDAADLLDGENVLSIIETGKPTYVWGFTDLLLEEVGGFADAPALSDLIIEDTVLI